MSYDIGLGIELDDAVRCWASDMPHLLPDGIDEIVLDLELRAGRYVVVRIDVTADPASDDGLTGEALRELAVREMVSHGARNLHAEMVLRTRGRDIVQAANGPTQEMLEVVATAYRFGYAWSRTPTRVVIYLLGLPRSKVARYLAAARDVGLLSETRERIAGGVVPTDNEES
jgi:hypothetical protein